MKRGRVLLVASVLLLWGCGSSGEPSASSTPTPTPTAGTPTATASPTPSPTPATRSTVGVYFVLDEHVQPVARTVEGVQVASGAVQQLLAGPTAAERAAGLTSTVPAGTTLLDIDITDGLATVDLSASFASGGGSASMTMRVAQLVHTLTRFPTVTGVALRLDGQPVTSLGGEGVDVRPPMTRAGFEDQAPAILVEQPLWGQRVTSPLQVKGTANTFEAVLNIELRAGTKVLVTKRVQATSGTGTRGTFASSLTFTTSASTGTLIGFVHSAKDGSRQDVVSIPVVLTTG